MFGIVGFVSATALVVGVCWQSGIWTPRQCEIYRLMSAECHPVSQELWHGRIQAGDSVDRIIWRTGPTRVDRYGRFTTLSYGGGFSGVAIRAKDGRLVTAAAASCTWQVIFFDQMTRADEQEYSDEYEKHWRPIREARARQAFVDAAIVVGLMAPPPQTDHILTAAGLIRE